MSLKAYPFSKPLQAATKEVQRQGVLATHACSHPPAQAEGLHCCDGEGQAAAKQAQQAANDDGPEVL